MPGFDAIYKQTVTLFNRVVEDETTFWIPSVLKNVHLIISKASTRDSYGGKSMDNATLHVRYKTDGNSVYIGDKKWLEPKEWADTYQQMDAITFNYGKHEDFDFFVEGEFKEFGGIINDDDFARSGFYNYMNSKYDNVFAISSVAKYNLIPHFEIGAR